MTKVAWKLRNDGVVVKAQKRRKITSTCLLQKKLLTCAHSPQHKVPLPDQQQPLQYEDNEIWPTELAINITQDPNCPHHLAP